MNKTVKKIIVGLIMSAFLGIPTTSVYGIDKSDIVYSKAYNATVNALQLKTQKSINDARVVINKLKNTGASWAIGEFSLKVDSVQQPILVNIVNSIIMAEKENTQSNINKAIQALSLDLPAVWRSSYSSAIDKIQQKLLNELVQLQEIANNTKNKEDIQRALNKAEEIEKSINTQVSTFAQNIKKQLKGSLNTENKDETKKAITFKDQAIEDSIRNKISKYEGELYSKDLNKIEYLKLEEVKDLRGIENLTNLKKLDFYTNGDLNLKPLENLNKLQGLQIYSFEKIKDISPLSKLTNLEFLNLCGNDIEDIKPIKNLKKLKVLDLSANFHLQNIEDLRELSNLENLSLYNTAIKNVNPLQKLSKLKVLDVGLNKNIEDVNGISKLDSLQYVNLETDKINDVKFLGGLKNLKSLNLGENNISDIRSLSTLENLQYLNLNNNNIKDINALGNLQKLTNLNLSQNIMLEDINILGKMTNLEELSITNTYVTSILPIKNLKNLKRLCLWQADEEQIEDYEVLRNFQKLEEINANLLNTQVDEIQKYIPNAYINRIVSQANTLDVYHIWPNEYMFWEE